MRDQTKKSYLLFCRGRFVLDDVGNSMDDLLRPTGGRVKPIGMTLKSNCSNASLYSCSIDLDSSCINVMMILLLFSMMLLVRFRSCSAAGLLLAIFDPCFVVWSFTLPSTLQFVNTFSSLNKLSGKPLCSASSRQSNFVTRLF